MLAKFVAAICLPGDTTAESRVQIQYISANGTRDELILPLLEAMLLLERLEASRKTDFV